VIAAQRGGGGQFGGTIQFGAGLEEDADRIWERRFIGAGRIEIFAHSFKQIGFIGDPFLSEPGASKGAARRLSKVLADPKIADLTGRRKIDCHLTPKISFPSWLSCFLEWEKSLGGAWLSSRGRAVF